MLIWLAALTLAFFALFFVDMALGRNAARGLEGQAPWPPLPGEPAPPPERAGLPPDRRPPPPVSIIIPARNEERNLAEALQSVLAQDYPALEIIAVNDRSTDRTGEILRAAAARDPRLSVIDVAELPPGWLGKNYALALGASRAGGEFLLFTDADVVMESALLRRAMGLLRARRADHLAIAPRILRAPASLLMFLGGFAVFFSLYARPWGACRRHDPAFVGIGAFNLVRRSAYQRAGGHAAIALRPDDDMKLGKILKRGGARQAFASGGRLLQVEWYASLRELIDGLMKNAFAGVNYNPLAVLAATAGVLAGLVWPFAALAMTHGLARWLNAGIVALFALIFCALAPPSGVPRRYFFAFPLAALLMLHIMWRAMLLTYKNGGIAWRGTHYPLARLRANRV